MTPRPPTQTVAADTRPSASSGGKKPSLTEDQAVLVESLAWRVVERVDAILAARSTSPAVDPLLTVTELAEALSVSPAWVYEHQDELGVLRLGGGAKPRLRFDLERAKSAMTCSTGGRSQAPEPSDDGGSGLPRRGRGRRLPSGLPKPGSVLAVRGERR